MTRSDRPTASSTPCVMNSTVFCAPARAAEIAPHLRASQGIERAERLIHQQDGWIMDERSGERCPLAHPARQLVWVLPLGALQTQLTQELTRGRLGLRPIRAPTDVTLQQNVVQRRPEVEQQVVLKDDADIRQRSDQAFPADVDLALCGQEQACDDEQQGALPAAARPDDADELPWSQGEVHWPEREHAARGPRHIRLGDIAHIDPHARAGGSGVGGAGQHEGAGSGMKDQSK